MESDYHSFSSPKQMKELYIVLLILLCFDAFGRKMLSFHHQNCISYFLRIISRSKNCMLHGKRTG